MTSSPRNDRTRPPSAVQLRSTLGAAYPAWVEFQALVAERVAPITPVWKFSTTWSLRLVHRKRVILYLSPRQGHFVVSFALGERAVAAAHAAKLAAGVLEEIDRAPRYAEGRGVRFPVRGNRRLVTLARLARIKHEN